MAETIRFLLTFVGGLGIGFFYYGGLWLTLQRMPAAKNPGALTVASFMVRLLVTLGLFYWLANGRLALLLTAFAGFIIMRFITVGIWREGEPEPVATDDDGAQPTSEPTA